MVGANRPSESESVDRPLSSPIPNYLKIIVFVTLVLSFISSLSFFTGIIFYLALSVLSAAFLPFYTGMSIAFLSFIYFVMFVAFLLPDAVEFLRLWDLRSSMTNGKIWLIKHMGSLLMVVLIMADSSLEDYLLAVRFFPTQQLVAFITSSASASWFYVLSLLWLYCGAIPSTLTGMGVFAIYLLQRRLNGP